MRHVVPWTLLFAVSGCGVLPGQPSADDQASGQEGKGRSLDSVDGGEPGHDDETPPLPPVPPPIYNCFAAGTPISTPAGERPIEALAVGDPVWAFDTARGARVRSVVTAVHRHPVTAIGKLSIADGHALLVTSEHPIYAPSLDRYVPAGELPEQTSVLLLNDDVAAQLSTVSSFERDFVYGPVFNITVAEQHNYFAAGVLVHNKSPPPCPSFNCCIGSNDCSVQWVILGMQGRHDLRGALLSVITSPAFLHEPP